MFHFEIEAEVGNSFGDGKKSSFYRGEGNSMNRLLYTEDGIGFVELITNTKDGDLLVVNAARCSFDKEHEEFDSEKDTRLIHYLAKHEHLLPFRHPHITLRLYTPIFVLRQISKHQVGMSLSEVSRRYITQEPEFWVPDEVRMKADNVKQGSSDQTLPGTWADTFDIQNKSCVYNYNRLLKAGAAPEQARAILPQSMYTTIVWTGSLLSWFHLWDQRTESHAQKETQEYAWKIGKIMNEIFPISWRALCLHSTKYNKDQRVQGVSWYEDLYKV